MSRVVDPILAELAQEAAVTRRLLELVPPDKLAWKPHRKSMSLGQLALHVASLPGATSGMLDRDRFNADQADFTPATPAAAGELLPTLDGAVALAKERVDSWDDAKAGAPWFLFRKGEAILSDPRIAVARRLMLNHWYHHRGQLTVYLRLLDVPLPATYGRSADDNPFA